MPGLSKSEFKKLEESTWSHLEFDQPYASNNTENLSYPSRFSIMYEWTFPERMSILERMHQVVERNPLAKAVMMWMRTFVVGNGGTLTYYNPLVQEVIEEFRAEPDNHISSYEREFCDGLHVDGELFIRFFTEGGKTAIVPLKPWGIYWIDVDPDNYKKFLVYHYSSLSINPQVSSAQEDIKAEDVMHVAINRYAYETRGRPDMISSLPWIKAYQDMLEERARIHRRKSIYYHLKLKQAKSGDTDAWAAKFQIPPAPGTFLVTNDQVDLTSVESNIHAEQAVEDLRQMKIMAIVASGMPEFFFADGAKSTLASATAQSMPALRMFDDRQAILEDVWTKVYQRVIQNAVDGGRIPEEVPFFDTKGKATGETVKAVDAFYFQYPEIRERDLLNLAKALQTSQQMKWSSRQTNSAKMGFDPNEEEKKMKDEGVDISEPPVFDTKSAPPPENGRRTSGPPPPPDDKENYSR